MWCGGEMIFKEETSDRFHLEAPHASLGSVGATPAGKMMAGWRQHTGRHGGLATTHRPRLFLFCVVLFVVVLVASHS
jgi:hypothetical protein